MGAYEETLFVAIVLAFILLLAWLASRVALLNARERERRSRILEAHMEKHFDTAQFIEFARSQAGLAWLRADAGASRLKPKLLALSLAGTLASMFGAALLFNAAWLDRPDDAWWGVVMLALGLGCGLAFVLISRLGRSWGLMDDEPGAQARDGR